MPYNTIKLEFSRTQAPSLWQSILRPREMHCSLQSRFPGGNCPLVTITTPTLFNKHCQKSFWLNILMHQYNVMTMSQFIIIRPQKINRGKIMPHKPMQQTIIQCMTVIIASGSRYYYCYTIVQECIINEPRSLVQSQQSLQ